MKKHFIIALCAVILAFASGCGRYVVQYTAPVVIAMTPAEGTTGVPSNESLVVQFSKSMSTTNMDIAGVIARVKYASDMNAVATYDAALTPEAVWSSDNSILTINNMRFVSSDAGAIVHIVASKDAFVDVNGLYLPENTELWNYKLQ